MLSTKRTLSRCYTLFRGQLDWYKMSKIISGLFSGEISTKKTSVGGKLSHPSENIIEFVRSVNPTRPLTLVVSVVDPEEIDSSGFKCFTMVMPDEWKHHGVEHHLLKMSDKVNNQEAIATILKIKKCIEENGSVYVQSHAGRSRSAMICAMYMTLFVDNPLTKQRFTFEEALNLLKSARKQVSLAEDKIAKSKEIIQIMQKSQASTKQVLDEKKETKSANLVDRLNALLISKITKDYILKLDITKFISRYGSDVNETHFIPHSHRGKQTKKIISLIKKPLCEEWFFTMSSPHGPLAKLVSADPYLDSKGEEVQD